MDSILHWNQIAIDANKTDFSTEKPEDKLEPQQGGPTRTSRALAIVHVAMYDAFVGVTGGPGAATYLTYTPTEVPGVVTPIAARAAVAAAACTTLSALYSKQQASFHRAHQDYIASLGGTDPDIALGLAWGELVARKMLASRVGDGSDAPDNVYAPSAQPLRHRVDPMNPGQGYLGPAWGKVKPFGVANLTTVIVPAAPPAPASAKYKADFKSVLTKGAERSTTRTVDETVQGIFWGYDGARNVGVPPRLYNQAVRAISMTSMATEAQNAKLFAAVNVAMADAGIYGWFEKYLYNLWRPVVGIREADPTWGPTGLGDGNAAAAATPVDPLWAPLGAPQTNVPGRRAVTPNFPAYPSGHATFGTAALRLAELILGLPTTLTFEFVSDEFDGENVDPIYGVRPRHNRKFTINSAIQENILSRVYLGVHWEFDGREGERVGIAIANHVAANFPNM
jgi:hypothetical protein